MNRRPFLLKSMLAGSGLIAGLNSSLAKLYQWFPKKRIVTISYNVFQFKGYPETDDTKFILQDIRAQMVDRTALELSLYKPDIITLQEAPSKDEVKKVAKLMDMDYVYFDGGFPGALLTNFEIISWQNCPLSALNSRGDLFSRHWGRATLKSIDEEIQLFSIHMHPSNDEIRAREVEEVLNVLNRDLKEGNKVILQGDFNHEPIQNEYDKWKKAGLIDCFASKGVEQPATIKSTFPNRTVDYIWVNEELNNRLLRCRVLFEGSFRTNPLDERSVALSDHLPVLAEFS